jgi:hypothetical protein
MSKRLIALAVVFILPAALAGQELRRVSSDEAQAYAQRLVELADKIDKPQVKIDADTSKANGIHVPDALGLLAVPQRNLQESEELAAQFKTEAGAPLGYLFSYRVLPVVDNQLIPADRLQTIQVTDDQGRDHTVYVFPMVVRQLSGDDYRLRLYGKEAKPLVDTKFSMATSSHEDPVAVDIKDPDESTRQGNVVITVFGKYQASFRAGKKDD